MARKPRVKFHHVQLTADRKFCQALEAMIEREGLKTGRARYPAAFVEQALVALDRRPGREIVFLIADLDLSVAGRAGAVRIPGKQWLKAAQMAGRLSRSSDQPCPVEWSARTVIVAALFCLATGR